VSKSGLVPLCGSRHQLDSIGANRSARGERSETAALARCAPHTKSWEVTPAVKFSPKKFSPKELTRERGQPGGPPRVPAERAGERGPSSVRPRSALNAPLPSPPPPPPSLRQPTVAARRRSPRRLARAVRRRRLRVRPKARSAPAIRDRHHENIRPSLSLFLLRPCGLARIGDNIERVASREVRAREHGHVTARAIRHGPSAAAHGNARRRLSPCRS